MVPFPGVSVGRHDRRSRSPWGFLSCGCAEFLSARTCHGLRV